MPQSGDNIASYIPDLNEKRLTDPENDLRKHFITTFVYGLLVPNYT